MNDYTIEVLDDPCEAFRLACAIPEFDSGEDALHEAEFVRRLAGANALVLVARDGDTVLGFKAGYDRYGDGSFYSWMGGVFPAARGRGVATRLLHEQERRVREAGYHCLYVKTRNRHRDMLRLLVREGYDIVKVDERDDAAENRLLLHKALG